jgi:hypothetical protein
LRSQAAEEAGLPFSSCIKTLDGATDSSFDVVVLDLGALKISPESASKLHSAKDDDHLIIFDDVLRYYALNNRQLYENRLGIKTEFIKIMTIR